MSSEHSKFSQSAEKNSPTQSQEAGLLIGLIISEQCNFLKDSLETGWSKEKAMEFLNDLYFEKKVTSARGMLNFIRDEGERTVYNIILPHFLASSTKRTRGALLKKNYMAINLFVKYCNNLSDCEPLLKEKELLAVDTKDFKRGILAWDMAKMISVARISFDAELISEEDAWKYIDNAYTQCQNAFSDWSEVAKSYAIGEAMKKGLDGSYAITLNHITDMLKEESSPWKQVGL